MPVTVQHILTATTPDNTTAEIRPSHWNSGHQVSISLAATEVVKFISAGGSSQSTGTIQFSNMNGVSFGLNNGTLTASHNALTAQSVQTQGIQSISAGGNQITGGQVVFSNSNGLAFGVNGSTITGSYTVPTQTAQSMGIYGSSQTTGASSSSTVDARSLTLVGAGGVSVGLTNGSVVISGATGGGGPSDGYNILAAGTQTAASATTVNFANSNGITFGMSGSAQITASHNGLTSQSAQAFSAANGSSAFQTLSFGDSNGLSFSVSNGSIVGSYDQTNQTVGFYGVSNTTGDASAGTFDARTLSIQGAGIASVGMSNGSVIISVPAGGGGGDGANILAAGTQTATSLGTVVFSNSNGISFGMSGSTRITASVAAQTIGVYAVSNSTQGSSGTVDARTLSIQGAGIASIGFSNGSLIVSVPAGGGVGDGGNIIIAGTQTAVTLGSVSFADSNGISFGLSGSTRLTASHNGLTSQSNQALSAANGSFAFQTASFSNANGVSFGTSAGSAITASVAAQTAQTVGLYASSNTTGQSSSSTVDARSLSIRGVGNISVGLSGGQIIISGSGGGGGGVNLSAGANSISNALVVFSNANGVSFALNGSTITASHDGLTSQSNQALSAANGSFAFQTANFSNANGISFGTSAGSAITASHNALTTAAQSNHSHGNPTLALTNLTGTTASASNGLTLSLSAAAAGSLNLSAGTTSNNLTAVTFSNSNGISFGMNGSTMTASHNAATSNHSHGNPTLALTNLTGTTASASNGFTLSLSAAAAGGANSFTVYALSNTTVNSSGTIAASALSMRAYGVLSIGTSNGSLLFSTPDPEEFTQLSVGFSTNGNTAGNTGLVTGQMVLAGGANITLSGSTNGNSMTVSVIGGAGGGGGGVGVSAGTQSVSTGTMVFSNSNNVSFGMSGSSRITASAVVNVSGGTTSNNLSAIVFSNSNGISFGMNGSTMTASVGAGGAAGSISAGTTSVGLGQVVFSNSNGVSFGLNGSTITASAAAAGVATLSVFGTSNTTVNSSGSFDARSLTIRAYGIVSIGTSNGSLLLSSPDAVDFTQLSVGFSTNGNTAGNTGLFTGRVVFAGGANITLSGSSNGNSATISVIGGAGGGGGGVAVSAGTQSVSTGTLVFSNSNGIEFGMSGSSRITANATLDMYANGNTTGQSSSTSRSIQSVLFNGQGGVSVGYSVGSGLVISGPAVSSLSATGQVSISVNGSTISIGVPSPVTNTNGYFPYGDLQLTTAQVGQASLLFDPQSFDNVAFDRVLFPVFNTNATNSSGSHTVSIWMGLYSRNVSTLSLVGSTSGSFAATHSGTVGSYSLFSGIRHFSVGSTATVTAGKYWMAVVSRSTSGGADGTYGNVVPSNMTSAPFFGIFGSSVNASRQFTLGQGYYSATTSGMPASVAFSQIVGNNGGAVQPQALLFANSTI